MKSFFKYVFATIFGLVIFSFLLFFTLAGIGSGSSSPKVSTNSVLMLNLNGSLPDLSMDDPFSTIDPFSGVFNAEPVVGLKELREVLNKAAKDDKIKAIWLNTDGLSSMPANSMELIRALEEFKSTGKLVYAYSDYMSELSLLINSVADKSYLNPMGVVDFNGMSSEIMYYTGLFEKLEVKPMIFYAGEFKSATEPFRLKSMSEENRLQVEVYLNSIYGHFMSKLSENRNISVDSLNMLANNLDVFMSEDALKYKLVDGLKYKDEVEAELKEMFGYKKEDKLKLVSFKKYKAAGKVSKSSSSSKNKIAVIYAEGEIRDGSGMPMGTIYGNDYVKMINKAHTDKDVKAIVLRVNSPGGSAFASEQILREIQNAQAKMPVVVSMGDVAASGGYYISASADKIVAEPSTITGSIGVFGLMFNIGDALNSKLGITFDRVKTHEYADFGSSVRPWSEKEKNLVTKSVQNTYQIFLKRVSDGRGISMKEADKIARGRVWTGADALKLGLVDTLGNIDAAIKIAKDLAKIENYELANFPEPKSTIDMILEELMGNKEESIDAALAKALGPEYYYLKEINTLRQMSGIQARIPYAIRFK